MFAFLFASEREANSYLEGRLLDDPRAGARLGLELPESDPRRLLLRALGRRLPGGGDHPWPAADQLRPADPTPRNPRPRLHHGTGAGSVGCDPSFGRRALADWRR